MAESACGEGVTVRDFAAGGDAAVTHPRRGVRHLSLAGEYLALAAGDGVTLMRWRTGEVVLRIPWVFTQSLGVQDDGTVVFVPSLGAGRPQPVHVASPAEPRVRTLDEGPAGRVRIARARVALSTPDGARVRRLDGTVEADASGAAVGDFDGERLAWARRPCGLLFIATRELGEAVPAPPPGPCPTPSLRSATLRAKVSDFSESVTVKLECPSEPALGCAGQLTLFAHDSRTKPNLRGREVDLAWDSYALVPGERRELTLPYQKRRVCIAGRNGLRPVVRLSGPSGVPGDGSPSVERRTVRVMGLDEAIARCSA